MDTKTRKWWGIVGRKPMLLERIYHPLYSTQKIIAGQDTKYRFFQKTDKDNEDQRDCNLQLGDRLSYPYYFKITGFSIIPSYEANPGDVRKFIDSGHFRFSITGKDYLYTPLDLVTYYNHLQGNPCSDGEPLATSKLKISEPVFQLPKQSWIDLVPLQIFNARIETQGKLDIKPFLVHLYFLGYQSRPVY